MYNYIHLFLSNRVPFRLGKHDIMRGLIVSLLFILSVTPVFAQHAALIPTEDPVYDIIDRMQRRGYFRELNPTARPYTIQELRSALSKIDHSTLIEPVLGWYAALDKLYGHESGGDEVVWRVSTQARLFQSTSKRQDALRPLADSTSQNIWIDPAIDVRGWLAWGDFVASIGATFDKYYDRDPDGLSVVNRLMSRGEDVYLGYDSKYFGIQLGRFGTDWARVGQEATLIGDDVRQYDRIQMHIGTERISLRSVYGELDNLDHRGEFSGRGFREGSTRRFVFAHRIDWRPHERWTFTVFEGDLISSKNGSLSLRYLQPLHFPFLESDATPKNFENNLMVGGGFLYHGNRLLFSVHGIIDDIVVEDRKRLKEAGRLEPATGQLTAMATVSDVLPAVDFGWQGALISSLSYRTDQKEGQWTFSQRGLASLFADYVHTRFFFDWYAYNIHPGLTVSPGIEVLWQGTGDYRDDFIEDYSDGRKLPNVLSGQEMAIVRPSVQLEWRTINYQGAQDKTLKFVDLSLKADIGFNATNHEGHIKGERSLLFQNTAGFRLKLGF